MNQKYIFLQLLSPEESCFVSGGNSYPSFTPTSRTGGLLSNASSDGRDINISTTGDNTTNGSNLVDPVTISLPFVPTSSSQDSNTYVVS